MIVQNKTDSLFDALKEMPTPSILGVLNITEDSFSDGGLFLEQEKAMEHGVRLMEQGASMLDLGAASSNPSGGANVSKELEWQRLKPLIDFFKKKNFPISIDTFHPQVQRLSIEAGVDMINDIHGFPHCDLYPLLAESKCKLVVMHSIQQDGRATVESGNPETILKRVTDFFDQRLHALTDAGVHPSRIILDPGMGFFLGAEAECSFRLLRALPFLKERYGVPMLVGVSRKSFLALSENSLPLNRGAATLAAEIYLMLVGVDWIRTHDVHALRQALTLFKMISK